MGCSGDGEQPMTPTTIDIIWTRHAEKRRKKRRLSRAEVERVARMGLKLGWFRQKARRFGVGRVNVVAALHGDKLVVVTVHLNRRPQLQYVKVGG